ncbi:MAG: phage holin family protein [Elainellaceae cyanobacterium]
MPIIDIIATWIAATISLIIVSKLPLGVEIDSLGKAAISGAVFGILNVIGQQLVPGIPITLGLVWFVINVIIFGLAAKLVVGFRLKWGIWSAILGAIFMAIVLSIVSAIIGALPGVS